MATTELEVSGGPDKADLLKSLANPGREISVPFRIGDGMFEAINDQMESFGTGGTEVTLEGHIHSGIYGGLCFSGTYDLDTRHGRFLMHIPPDAAPAL